MHQGSKGGPTEVAKAGLKPSQLAVSLPGGATWWWRATACDVHGCTPGEWVTFKTAV